MPAGWRLLGMAATVTSAAFGVHPACAPGRIRTRRGYLCTLVADRLLYHEYGLQAAERSSYTGPGGASLDAEAWRFGDSGGAHAAYLSLRPDGEAPSPLAEYIAIEPAPRPRFTPALLYGVTVAAYRNHIFRFQGAPDTGQFERMLASLRQVDPAEPGSDGCSPSPGATSEHILLVSLSLEKVCQPYPVVGGRFRAWRVRVRRTPGNAGRPSVKNYFRVLQCRHRAGAH
jgi:hypothetical protein